MFKVIIYDENKKHIETIENTTIIPAKGNYLSLKDGYYKAYPVLIKYSDNYIMVTAKRC